MSCEELRLRAKHGESANNMLVLVAVCLAGLIMPFSFTGPSVALPAVAHDLDAGVVALGVVDERVHRRFRQRSHGRRRSGGRDRA